MALWAQIVLLIILGLIALILTGIRDILVDGMKAINNRLQEISGRLDELCGPERERKKAIRETVAEIFK